MLTGHVEFESIPAICITEGSQNIICSEFATPTVKTCRMHIFDKKGCLLNSFPTEGNQVACFISNRRNNMFRQKFRTKNYRLMAFAQRLHMITALLSAQEWEWQYGMLMGSLFLNCQENKWITAAI